MRIIPVSCFWLVVMCSCNKTTRPLAVGPVPSDAQLRWHEMETNAFIHFTINTFTDKEWGFGDESPELFNPTGANVDQWITTLRDAGFKGVILTTKHHDGFCLWPSTYTDHTVAKSPYKNGTGDLVKEVADACNQHGLKFGIYMSPWDRNRSDYGDSSYVEYYRNQLKELFTAYGPVFEMWFDGANGGDGYYGGANEKRRINGAQYYDWPATLAIVRQMEPEVIFFSDAGPGVRWVGNERGVASETNWNTITPDTLYAGKANIEGLLGTGHENGSAWIPAEVDVSIRPGWFYHEREDSLVKSAEKLFEIYLTSVGRGSTLLLNVPPDKRGLIHERDVNVLREWKAMRDRAFASNLASGAAISASTYRGNDKTYAADRVNDGDNETFWATDDDETSASLQIELTKPRTINYILLQEYIKLGQRVKHFSIEYFDGTVWKKNAEETTIGYKRIVKIDPVTAQKIRINIIDAKACPLISNIEVY
jgi:alpha-L-fucosidase